MNCDQCQHCIHSFEPRITQIGIREVRDILFACSSQQVWLVWRNQRYPIKNFRTADDKWALWSGIDEDPMTLGEMHESLRDRDNWSRSDSLRVHVDGANVWGWVYRIEETRTMLNLEDETEAEDITGEILIYIHTKEDVQLAWRRYIEL